VPRQHGQVSRRQRRGRLFLGKAAALLFDEAKQRPPRLLSLVARARAALARPSHQLPATVAQCRVSTALRLENATCCRLTPERAFRRAPCIHTTLRPPVAQPGKKARRADRQSASIQDAVTEELLRLSYGPSAHQLEQLRKPPNQMRCMGRAVGRITILSVPEQHGTDAGTIGTGNILCNSVSHE